jgi:uncharacterized protein (TIRG00374 family)
MKSKIQIDNKQKIRIALLVAMAIGFYGILPQLGAFKGSVDIINNADILLSVMAFLASLATYFFASAVYCSLAIKPIHYFKTVIMQFSAMFVNRLLPAGVGAIGMNAAYLHKNKHTLTESGIVVGLNNATGLVGHALLLFVVYLVWPESFSFNANIGHNTGLYLAIGLSIIFLIALVVLRSQSKAKINNFKKQLTRTADYYKNSPIKLIAATVFAMCLTMSFTICLWLSLAAVGIDVSIAASLLLLTFGVGAGTAIPTPGGLGGMEAGIYAGLIALQVSASPALAGILLFRLLSYWIPLFIGLGAFIYTQNKGYITSR